MTSINVKTFETGNKKGKNKGAFLLCQNMFRTCLKHVKPKYPVRKKPGLHV